MKAFLYHMRPWQWYKNLVVFLALLFSGHLFEAQSVIMTGFAFILLCFLSSGNYMVNDVFDWKRDKQHTEKKQRMIKLALAFSGVTMVFLVLFVLLCCCFPFCVTSFCLIVSFFQFTTYQPI